MASNQIILLLHLIEIKLVLLFRHLFLYTIPTASRRKVALKLKLEIMQQKKFMFICNL